MSTVSEKDPVVLIVDDVPKNLQVLGTILKNQGFKVNFAQSGEQALEVIPERRPDAILLDVSMPEMNGFEVCQRIKSMPAFSDIPIIFLTARTEAEDIIQGFKVGGVDYITKPFNSMELIARLKTHLDLQRTRRTAEERLAELERLNEQIKHNNDELQRLNEEKNEFLGIAAHDLKNPVNAIRMAARIIENDAYSLSPEEIAELSSDIRTTAERMFELIQNLLDVNRIETNNVQVTIEEAQITPIMENLFRNYKEIAGKKNITLHFSAADGLPTVQTDRKLLYQIADNLVSNAIKFTPQERNIYIKILSVQKPDYPSDGIVIAVKDEGPGLTPEDMQKLFTKFARLSARPTGSEHSTGLGLSIVRRLAEMIGSEVTCSSEYGFGAEFRIFIPLAVQ